MENNIFKKIGIFCASFVVLTLALTGYFTYVYHANFFYNRFIFLFQDDNANDNVIMIELTKFNLLPYYYHYQYSAKLFNENAKTYVKKYEFHSAKNNFHAADFIKKFDNNNNYNTLNENYLLSFELDNKHYTIDLQNLTGDFLINNSLEKFTYINLGTTTITLDGKKYESDFEVTKTQSINMKKSVSGPKTKSTGMLLFLSDKKGNLYYADITEVLSGGDEYMSHAWALHKNDNALNKEVDSRIMFSAQNNREGVLDLPDFQNARIKINAINNFFIDGIFYDLIKGEILNDFGEEIITGFRLRYGKDT